MSARAIRALRGNNEDLLGAAFAKDDEEDENDDDESSREAHKPAKPSAFVAMMDSDSEDDDDQENEESMDTSHAKDMAAPLPQSGATHIDAGVARLKVGDEDEEEESEEDLDELIDEFQAQDAENAKVKAVSSSNPDTTPSPSPFGIILSGLNVRDLDVEYSLRTSLMGGSNDGDDSVPSYTGQRSRQRTNARQQLMFGPARDEWVRPPHFVGGGMGMSTYDQEPRPVPWPYSGENSTPNDTLSGTGYVGDGDDSGCGEESLSDPKRWFFFQHSDSYRRACEDYEVIKQSGDLNSLIMFVIHHPYVTQALLQLCTVLYQNNQSHEGRLLLRRCLWIYECSALLSFSRDLRCNVFMDVNQPENEIFFKALFKLIQVSNISGVTRTALAVSRFLLSLDPLRDPMAVLVAMDHYALASNSVSLDQWLVELVESRRVRILYRGRDSDRATTKTHECGLLELPNWAYSYALALFRLSQSNELDETLRNRADVALEAALSSFPSVVGMLLQHLEVDTIGRSFRRDWISVLDFATDRSKQLYRMWSTLSDSNPIELAATLQARDKLIKIFVHQNAKHWGDDSVLQWMYDSLTKLKNGVVDLPGPPSPAMLRYASCNPTDYENRIEQLPQDANLIDPEMVAHAMAVNPNRPRLLRNMQRGAFDIAGPQIDANGLPVAQPLWGGPPSQVVDPDWPIAEVFLRSFLPWNRVEGVPPPPR